MPSTQPPRPEVLALLRECKERVWDDTPRLVLADWLQENGSEAERALGEVMQSQVRRTVWPWRHYFSGSTEYLPHEEGLIHTYRQDWLGNLAGETRWSLGRGLFRCECQASEGIDSLLDSMKLPEGIEWIETVCFAQGLTIEHCGRIATSPVLDTIGVLDMVGRDCGGGLDDWRRFFTSPHLRRLSGLRFPPTWSPLAFEAFLGSGNLARLTIMDLSRATLNEESLRAFFHSDLLEQLGALNLNHAIVESKELAQLARSPRTRNLHDLFLYVHQPEKETLAGLFRSPHLPSLRRLDLQPRGPLSPGNIEALVNSSLSLTYLALGNSLAVDCIRILVNTPWVSQLRYLALPGPIDLKAATVLAGSPYLDGLQTLKVRCYDKPEKSRQFLRERFGARWLD